jgi:hypothetical protein
MEANTLPVEHKVIVEVLLHGVEEDVLGFSEGVPSYNLIYIPL